MIALVLLLAQGCCPTLLAPPPPPLPAGRPLPAEDAQVKTLLERWDAANEGSDRYTIMKQELIDVLLNRLFWRAYAEALEKAGDWR